MDWHRKQDDPWTWHTWQVTTGEATGAYVSTSFGHTWKDLDTWDAKFAQADVADAATNMDPYTAGGATSVWVYLSGVSRPSESREPSKMATALHFVVKPGAGKEFNNALRKIDEGIRKTNWQPEQPYEWYALANGGEGGHHVLILARNSWAEMAQPEVSFEAMLEKAYGRDEAESLLHSLSNSIRREWSEMLVYRPDLSYTPAGK